MEISSFGDSSSVFFYGLNVGRYAFLISVLKEDCGLSTAMVAAVGTGEAFDRGRDFGAWLGLVPRQYSTGGKPILGRISKQGNRYLRTLFVQAAHVILMRPHNWEKFSFGPWLEQASQRMHKNKLAAALANKLARIAWSVLRNGRTFDINQIEVTAV